MTTLDPSHLPSHRERHGQAVYDTPGPSHSRIPRTPLPDLRFEQSYLLSIKPYIHASPSAASQSASHVGNSAATKHSLAREAEGKATLLNAGTNENAHELVHSIYGAPISIEWKGVLWITVRDQILSPLAQGALWGVASLFILPITARVGGYIRSRAATAIAPILPQRRRSQTDEVGWWRQWVRSFYSGVGTNVVLK